MGDLLPGGYLLGEQIGSGGMGIVHAASTRRGQQVVVKVVHPDHVDDGHSLDCMQREIIAGQHVRHPNVAALVEYCDAAEQSFLVMERARGELLGGVIARHGALSFSRVCEIGREILAGLEAIHAAGFIHADIKSDNIVVELGDTTSVKIIDLGLARRANDDAADRDRRGRRVLSGTAEYMAPEIIGGGRVTTAADIYAVGVILYEALTGQTPFGGGHARAVLQRHVAQPVVPPSLRSPHERAVPIALERAVLCALEKEPRARFRTAGAFGAALAIPLPEAPDRRMLADGSGAFSTLAPTNRWACSELLSDSPSVNDRVRTLRTAMIEARRRSAHDEVISGSLDVARLLVDDGSLAAARAELEDTLDALTGGAGSEAVEAPPTLWRLLVTLAALYSGLRDPVRARSTALAAHRHAIRHDSEVGRERASALLRQLGGTLP